MKLAASLLLIACLLPSPALAADPVPGWASTWGGPGSAAHDCVWPWTACTPRRVTSLATGRSIVTVPQMYCLCLVPGTPHPLRLIDLGPAEWAALGLPGPGMYEVTVELLTGRSGQLPNTSTLPSEEGT